MGIYYIYRGYIPLGYIDIYFQKIWNVTFSYQQNWASSQILALLAAFINTLT